MWCVITTTIIFWYNCKLRITLRYTNHKREKKKLFDARITCPKKQREKQMAKSKLKHIKRMDNCYILDLVQTCFEVEKSG